MNQISIKPFANVIVYTLVSAANLEPIISDRPKTAVSSNRGVYTVILQYHEKSPYLGYEDFALHLRHLLPAICFSARLGWFKGRLGLVAAWWRTIGAHTQLSIHNLATIVLSHSHHSKIVQSVLLQVLQGCHTNGEGDCYVKLRAYSR